jgi:uncharacterized membrane protein YphA (DoxX/SURF4 family)
MISEGFARFVRVLVGGTFVWTGAIKILEPAPFALSIGNYRLVPHELINIVAILVPWTEVIAGLCVLAGIWLRAGALIIMVITAIFFLAVASALARGLDIECACFGTVGGKRIGLHTLAIDFALFCLSALLVGRPMYRSCG